MHGNTGHSHELEPHKVDDRVEVRDSTSPFHGWSGTIKEAVPAGALDTPHYRVEARLAGPPLLLYFSHAQLVKQPF